MDFHQDICLLSSQGFQKFSPLMCRHPTKMSDIYMSVKVIVYSLFYLLKTLPEHPEHGFGYIPRMMLQSSAESKPP